MFTTGLSTQDKALKINLDNAIYGSFAEIGAGQEVGRWFFRAGAASKTVAKSMSAYDMTFSDAIYGPEKNGRYVCESRLLKMLDHEYKLLIERLWDKRAETTTFFSYADTVATTSFKKKGGQEGRGWIGVRFQRKFKGEPNEIVLHVRLFDQDPLHQQEQLGILGTNLLYGAFFLIDNPTEFLPSLVEGINEGALEVEMIRTAGPDLKHIDNRIFALNLMEAGLTDAVLFDPNGSVIQPSDVLFRKNVLVQRGSFRPFTLLHQDMMEKGRDHFCSEKGGCDPKNTILLMEMTTQNFSQKSGFIEYEDFLDRVEMLNSLGHHVLISKFSEFYKLRQYLSRYTHERLGLLVGAIHLDELFSVDHYKDLKGGILEAFGILHSDNTTLYVYPAKRSNGSMLTVRSFAPHPQIEGLFEHLKRNDKILDIYGVDDRYLHILSRDTAKKIAANDVSWEKDVPQKVAELIKTKRLFLDTKA